MRASSWSSSWCGGSAEAANRWPADAVEAAADRCGEAAFVAVASISGRLTRPAGGTATAGLRASRRGPV
jgi:hypothetical protein